MTVLYFGVFNSEYSRNKILVGGLRRNRINVLEINDRSRSFLKYLKLAFQYLKIRPKFDVMIVGFPGQEAMFLARFLTLLPGSGWAKPIIFDAFTSHYGGYILDRKKYGTKSFHAKWYRFLDKWSCKLADLVFLDTEAHIDFFVKEYGLPKNKFRKIWASADTSVFYPQENSRLKKNKFTVLFFGTYIPLQGVEYIIRAAKILEKQEDLVFILVGDGQERRKINKLSAELKPGNIIFKEMMPPNELRDEIAGADVCLGVFGSTIKAQMVIPNKVFISLAMKKPVITSDTPAIRELFSKEEILLIKPADEDSLAGAVLKLKNDSVLRDNLAEKGYDKFIKFASPDKINQELNNLVNQPIQ